MTPPCPPDARLCHCRFAARPGVGAALSNPGDQDFYPHGGRWSFHTPKPTFIHFGFGGPASAAQDQTNLPGGRDATGLPDRRNEALAMEAGWRRLAWSSAVI